MKIITKEVHRYLCSVCEREFYRPSGAEECEKTNSCKHKNLKYEINSVGEWPVYLIGIEQKCLDCKQIVDTINFDILDNGFEEKKYILKKVFKFFKQIDDEIMGENSR